MALVFGSGFCGNPANPGWILGCVCLGTCFGFALPILAGICGRCFWGRVLLAPANPRWSVGVCAFMRVLRWYPTIRGWGVWCVCSGTGVPRRLWLGCLVRVWALASPRQSLLGSWRVCVSLRSPPVPRQSCRGKRCGRLCLCLGFGSTPPFLARVFGCLCVLRLYPANPGWGSWCVCMGSSFGFDPTNPGWGVEACVFVCALCLHPACPGRGVRCRCVCFCAGFGCAPPFLAGALGCVYLCARSARTAPILAGVRGACAWGLVLACTPPILAGVFRYVYLCAWSACSPPILAGVCGVDVCASVRVWAAPRHSWLGCWGVCVCVRAAPPVPHQSWLWFVVCVCGCGFGPSPGKSWLGCWGVFVFVRAPLAPCHSWLGCAVWLCALRIEFRLHPAIPGWVLGCVCLCERSACYPPILAGVCVVCASVRVLACSPPLLAGVLECACLFVCSACTLQPLAGMCGAGVFAWVWFPA